MFLCFREDVNKMYQELDKDFDGKLSWKEFIGLIKGVYKEMSFFDRLATGRQLAQLQANFYWKKKNQKQGFPPCPYPWVRFG